MDDPEDVIAFGHRRDDDPEGHHVVDLVERRAPFLHLLVDRPEMLRPPGHVELGNTGPGQLLFERLLQGVDHFLPDRPLRGHLPGERGVHLRLEELEREVLELRLHLRHAEPVGERRVDLPGLGRDP
jgi:hypothetical protein